MADGRRLRHAELMNDLAEELAREEVRRLCAILRDARVLPGGIIAAIGDDYGELVKVLSTRIPDQFGVGNYAVLITYLGVMRRTDLVIRLQQAQEDLASGSAMSSSLGTLRPGPRRELQTASDVAECDQRLSLWHPVQDGILGRGGFGEVRLHADKGGRVLAVKYIDLRMDRSHASPYQAARAAAEEADQEVQILTRLSHPNIVRYFWSEVAIARAESKLYVCMEYMGGGTLESMAPLGNHSRAVDLIRQVILALDYLHNKEVAHRDIKGGNVLLSTDKMVAKLADFGLAKVCNAGPAATSMVGTLAYAAPEILRGGEYDAYQADMWSLGVTVLHTITKNTPFPFHPSSQYRDLVMDNNTDMSVGYNDLLKHKHPVWKKLVDRCLVHVSTARRPSPEALLDILA